MNEEPISPLSKSAELPEASPESTSALKFFESLDLVNRAMQGATDLEKMMSDCLDAVLVVFGCDRAFLMYPCDPDATTWFCPMERTTPKYPGVLERGISFPMTAEIKRLFKTILGSQAGQGSRPRGRAEENIRDKIGVGDCSPSAGGQALAVRCSSMLLREGVDCR
jgi:hypothetical protein